ncbi:MAG TPA: hypothetical protein VIN08_04335 [Ohtaekwangia sp.]|uniref:hypothetical protein n=1 Tax=Ohtaekwangia sp. TaxID=2066019 RepID=UPI002F944C9B
MNRIVTVVLSSRKRFRTFTHVLYPQKVYILSHTPAVAIRSKIKTFGILYGTIGIDLT